MRMAYHFTSKDLQYKYDWKAKDEGDNPKIVGFPDRNLLNRGEGYEVLPFIIRFVESLTWTPSPPNVATGQKVVRLIHACPGHLRSHKNIRDWVLENWKTQ